MKKLYAATVTLSLLCILMLRPVPLPTKDNTYTDIVIINHIYEGSSSDIIFELNGIKKKPYINRGIELGLDINHLRKHLIGKPILMTFIKHWTPLSSNRSIARIALSSGDIIFNRLES